MKPVIDDSLVVSLEETRKAMRLMAEKARIIAEGAGALPLAAALSGKAGPGPIVCIVSGGNLDLKKFCEADRSVERLTKCFSTKKKCDRFSGWRNLIPAMADAMRDLSAGKVEQPLRLILPVKEHKGFFGVMPAYGGALGAKLVTFYPNNRGLPTHHAMIVLFRPETGEPLVTMDGRLITEMRTAAVSAVATDLLARREVGGARDPRFGGAGSKPPRSAPNRQAISRGARLESAPCRRVREKIQRRRRGLGRGSRARRGRDRRRNLSHYADPAGRMAGARRAHQRRRCDAT